MAKELATKTKIEGGLPALTYTKEQVDLIKRLYCKNSTDDEFALFRYVCEQTGLNPMLRQIHAVKRWDSETKAEKMAIQVGIDGYRVQAERTRCYCPGREVTFTYEKDGKLKSATAYVLKKVDGEWREVASTAFYSEYVQTTKDGNPNRMWGKMPHGQLAKCAEALALRKAFSEQLSAIRTDEEMGQADNEFIQAETVAAPKRLSETKTAATKLEATTPNPTKNDSEISEEDESKGDAQESVYLIEKVTKSALGHALFFLQVSGGGRWVTDNEEIGGLAKVLSVEKIPVILRGSVVGANGATVIDEMLPVREEVAA